MKKIEEKTLEAALIKASIELGCSVADLEYEIVQNPSNGFLNLGKKNAIIIVDTKTKEANTKAPKAEYTKSLESIEYKEPKYHQEHLEEKKESPRDFSKTLNYESYTQDFSQDIWGKQEIFVQSDEHQDDEANVAQICAEIKELFAMLPFEIDKFDVFLGEDNELSVYIDGRDCALLIGERGYRYKALSYLLFNWINPKYGYTLRLEIAEFLKNQEEMIDVYLKDIVRLVKANGKAQTKTLEGILVYIALNKLRDIFPDKYVSLRQTEADEKYIIINEFRR